MKTFLRKLTVAVMIWGCGQAYAQREAPPKPSVNVVYAELLGNGYMYSLNYDRLIYHDENLSITARAGITPGFVNLFRGVGIPLEMNAQFLRNNGHSAEAGPGFSWFNGKSVYRNEERDLITSVRYNVCNVTLRFGYRYAQPGGGLILRAAFIPSFNVVAPEEVRIQNFFPFGKAFTPWAGLSIGYAFKNK